MVVVSMGTTPLCFIRDVIDLQSRLADMEHQYKRLVEELSAKNQQLEAADEQCTSLNQQIDRLNSIVKTFVRFSVSPDRYCPPLWLREE